MKSNMILLGSVLVLIFASILFVFEAGDPSDKDYEFANAYEAAKKELEYYLLTINCESYELVDYQYRAVTSDNHFYLVLIVFQIETDHNDEKLDLTYGVLMGDLGGDIAIYEQGVHLDATELILDYKIF